MVSCTDCAHYNACKKWANHTDNLVDALNNSYLKLKEQLKIPLVTVDHLAFPFVAETKEMLCENYAKAKENV